MAKKLILGLTGSFGSGGSTTAEYLEKKGFIKYSLSDIIKEEAAKQGKSNLKRNDLQNIGDELREKNGTDYLANIIIKQMDLKSQKYIVIKSIRNYHEALLFSNTLQNFFLFNIDAPKKTRYNRVKDEYTTLSDFQKDDERDSGEDQPENGQQVRKCSQFSDVVIINDKQKKDLYQFIDGYINLIKDPYKKKPQQMEVYMAHAFHCSYSSTCLNRKVGAVIVKNGHIIASGYNDAPKKVISCEQLGKCHRKYFQKCWNCNTKIASTLSECINCKTEITKEQKDVLNKHLDLCRAVHAEERAILQVSKFGGMSIKEATLYTTTFPCLLCAKKIIEVGISEVIYTDPYPYIDALSMLEKANIKAIKFHGIQYKALDKFYSLL